MENLEEKISEYREKLACQCGCGGNLAEDGFVMKLMFAQGVYGKELNFTSGYRCTKQNSKVGGHIDSGHLYGVAADIFYKTPSECLLLLKAILGAGFERIEVMSLEDGIEKGKGGAHLHVDEHPKKTEPWFHIGEY
jgi:hypothetical protein